MAAFLIDPDAQTISDIEEQFDAGIPFLENVRKLIGSTQLFPISVANDALVCFIDNFGLLKRGNKLWRFEDGKQRFAGKALMFAVSPDDGNVAPIIPDRIEDIRRAIVFEPEVELLRIEELLLTEPGKAPSIARIPIYSDDPEPEPLRAAPAAERTLTPMSPPPNGEADPEPPEPAGAIIDQGWVVRASRSGGVTATRYRYENGILTPYEMRSAKDMNELRALKPPEMTKVVEPGDDEPEDVLEFWVA